MLSEAPDVWGDANADGWDGHPASLRSPVRSRGHPGHVLHGPGGCGLDGGAHGCCGYTSYTSPVLEKKIIFSFSIPDDKERRSIIGKERK